jgi:hypothetical protein
LGVGEELVKCHLSGVEEEGGLARLMGVGEEVQRLWVEQVV